MAAVPGKGSGALALAAVAIIGLLALALGAVVVYPLLFPAVWTEQLGYLNSTGQHELIVIYRNATDVTAAQLAAFMAEENATIKPLLAADADCRPVEYAAWLHDRAEESRINCSLVPLEVSAGVPGHVLLAFHTTDRGMCYVDPAGENVSAADYPGIDYGRVVLLRDSWRDQLPEKNDRDGYLWVTDCRNASAISYAELLVFLADDRTEDTTYVPGNYTCSDYAVRLHDAAEAAGFKCAVVAVSFEGQALGHCFNAFLTTDKGIVCVDDTGPNASQLDAGYKPADKAVYLANGSELGELPLAQVDGNLDYAFYRDRMGRMQSYVASCSQYVTDRDALNQAVLDFNAKVQQNDAFYAAYRADASQYATAVDAYNAYWEAVAQGASPLPPQPLGTDALGSWRRQLEARYQRYADAFDSLAAEQRSLAAQRAALEARRQALATAPEAQWITYYPPGEVTSVQFFW